MINDDSANSGGVIASISNRDNENEIVDIVYLQDENAFVTAGIQRYFAEKEILIPSHLVVKDLQLIGAIISTVLEKLSQARENDSTFSYASRLQVLDRTYSVSEYKEYMQLSLAGE